MSGFIMLVNASSWDGMLFDKIILHRTKLFKYTTSLKDLLDRLPAMISSPLYDCIICMSPWWSIGLGWPLFFGSWQPTDESLVFLGIVVWINVLVDTFVLGKREGL